MDFICNKKTFETPQEAQKRANEINKENKSKGDKTKLRPYRCKKCRKMHLTSMHRKKYQATKDVGARNNTREKKFIKQEGEYWESKFNK